jgi:hypothetical protein
LPVRLPFPLSVAQELHYRRFARRGGRKLSFSFVMIY